MAEESTSDLSAEQGIANDSRQRDEFVENRRLNSVLHTIYSLATACLLAVTAALLIQIATRTANVNVQGLQAVAQLFAVWMSFLVVGNLEFEDKHIEIDFFVDLLPETARAVLEVVVLALSTLWAVTILFSAFLAVQAFAGTTIPTLGISTSALHAAPLLGMCLLVLAYLMKLVSYVRDSVTDGTQRGENRD